MAAVKVFSDKAGATGPTTVTTAGVDSTVADLIVVNSGAWADVVGLSDSYGNSWVGIAAPANLGVRCQSWYCVNPIVGAGHTFTLTGGGGSYPSIEIVGWSGASGGILGTPLGVETSGGVALNTGAILPAGNNAIVVSGIGWGNNVAGPAVAGGALTVDEYVAYVGGQHMPSSICHEIQTTATSRAAAWTWTGSVPAAAWIAVFSAGIPAPVPDAGPDQTVNLCAGATLAGSATGDPTITYLWTQDSGPASAVFADDTDPTTTVTFPTTGVYVLRLTATNGGGSAHDTVQITVTNDPPVVDAGADQVITYPINFAALCGTVTDDFFTS